MNPFEKLKKVFTPERIAELAKANQQSRYERYPILRLISEGVAK